MADNITEAILKRDRYVIVFGLAAVILLSWAYTAYLTLQMGISMWGTVVITPHTQAWTSASFMMYFLMWSIMMIAMMTPSAAPMLLFYAKIIRQKQPGHEPFLKTSLFLLGYLVVWIGFSAAATLVQWALNTAALVSMQVVRATPILGGVILILAGAFQFSQLKNACLTHCRTPVGFIMTDWKDGKGGALQMGVKHGIYCVGCCWLLMALLFVAGVMNLLWMAIITIFVLVEKVLPAGDRISRYTGVLFIVWGILSILMQFI